MHDQWLAPEFVFDEGTLHRDVAVRIQAGQLTERAERARIPDAQPMPGGLSPGFVDLQVNGGGGALLNTAPTPEGIATLLAAHRRFGTTALMPTLITDAPEVLDRAAAAIAAMWGQPGLAGFHIEGPHIDPARPGTHAPHFIRPLDARSLAVIAALRAKGVVVMVTLAPCSASLAQITALAEQGVIVALGHSNASAETAEAAFNAGARAVTHLFNAMSPMTSRAPGLTGAAINSDAYVGLIADGVHVDDRMIGLACRARPKPDRCFLVSDAMPSLGGPERFQLYDQQIALKNGRLINADGNLAGAHLCLAWAVRHMVAHVGVSLQEALRMAITVPADLIGQSALGRLQGQGWHDLVRLDAGGTYLGPASGWSAAAE